MKTVWRRYLNEIVGLTIMALMAMALIDGEAHAVADDHASNGDNKVIEIWFNFDD